MKDLIGKLTNLEATAPKPKKMLTEDAVSPMTQETAKPSFKDVYESIAGMKPIPVVGKEGGTQQTGAGFLNVTDNSPAAQALGKALGDLAGQKKVQIVVPTAGQVGQQQQQQQQPTAAGQPNPNQLQPGQQAVQEKDEGKPGKNFAKIAKSAGKRYGSKEAGERVAGAVRAKLAAQGKLEETNATTTAQGGYVVKDGTKVKKFKTLRAAKSYAEQHGGKVSSEEAYVPEGAKVDRMVKHIEKSERKLGKSKDEAEDIAWATANKRGYLDNKNKKKMKEADIPSSQGVDTRGAGLGAGRSATTLEGKKAKPDFLDMDKDGNKEEPMKKAIKDKKKTVKEGLNGRISAARHEGRADGLRGGKNRFKDYDDLEEARAYHEGYKDGLDECYGQGVYETAPAATVPGMADAAMDEGNAFTAALAKTPKGGKFSVGGKSFTDRTSYDAPVREADFAFEAWDRELQNLLTESETVSEGLSVSVSKGQQNSPDSVTITAQDAEADQLLQLVKHAGLGLFGDEQAEPSSAMSVQPSMGEPDEVGAGGVDIDVVDGSDDMLSLMQKLSGVEASGAGDEDYADEEGHDEFHSHREEEGPEQETNEATCNECGMMEAGCQCDKEQVEEVESEDQQEFEVAEDNAPDSGAEDSVADENAESKEDAALAGEEEEEMNEGFAFESLLKRMNALVESKDEEEDEEEDVTESKDDDEDENPEEDGPDHGKAWYDTSDELKEEELTEWANQVGKGEGKGTDASFQQDIDFMTKVISGGLNKPKSTGQTTVPVIAGQDERMHDNPNDWAKLAGIKK